MSERANQVVKLRCELLTLEQLGLLVGEASVLISGRPLRKNHGESASLPSWSQIRRPETTATRRSESQIDRGTALGSLPGRSRPTSSLTPMQQPPPGAGGACGGGVQGSRVTRVRRRLCAAWGVGWRREHDEPTDCAGDEAWWGQHMRYSPIRLGLYVGQGRDVVGFYRPREPF